MERTFEIHWYLLVIDHQWQFNVVKYFFILLSLRLWKHICIYHIIANIVPVVRTFEIHWYLLGFDHFCNCLQLISIAKYVWLQILRFADTHSLLFKVSQVSLLHSCVHTSYLSRTPQIYWCKFFLAGVNFYRFHAKNWQFTVYFAVITQKIGNFLCILS